MISKELAVPLSIIVLFCFSSTSIAGGLHFGIIDAIEDQIDELREKKTEEPDEPEEPAPPPELEIPVLGD